MNAHAVNARAEAIISLLDVWVCQPENLTLPWFPWFPIDHEPIPDKVLEIARRATRGITMSRFGQKMAENAGLETLYVPHGVDTGVFRPIDRGEARKYLGLPEDAFVVGMVAANKGNPPRKSFFEQIAAFQQLKIQHPDALLYLHTDDGTHGGETVNLVRFCERLGLRPAVDVVFCDQYINALGFKDEYMVAAYNAMDVLTLASLGEGFGIPLVEAQACGTPVITGEWTAMGELCFSGWKIPKAEAQREYHDYFDAYQWRVNVEAVEQRLVAAYEMRGNQQYRSRARDGALAYDADKIVEKYWTPLLAEIERLVREAVQA
jgi:glycosyltransferase involved in cell wall biosynthesis